MENVQVGTPCKKCTDGTYTHLDWQDERDQIFTCRTCWHKVEK